MISDPKGSDIWCYDTAPAQVLPNSQAAILVKIHMYAPPCIHNNNEHVATSLLSSMKK